MYWSDSVDTASLANHQMASDCGGQNWTIGGTNLNAVWSWKKMQITEIKYTTDHKIEHIYEGAYTPAQLRQVQSN